MSKESILKDFKEIKVLQKSVDQKVKATKSAYEQFLSDQSIDLKERYLLWLKAPRDLHQLKDLSSEKGIVGKGLHILMDNWTGCASYDVEVDFVYFFPDYFYTDDDLIGNELLGVVDLEKEEKGTTRYEQLHQVFYETLNYIVSHNIGSTYQWLEP